MRLARVRVDGAVSYARLEDDVAVLLGGFPEPPRVAVETGRVGLAAAELLVPVEPTKVVAIGRNYAAHAAEVGLPLGSAPSVFLKPLQCLVGDGGQVMLPPRRLSTRVEHEGELAIVIGRAARRVTAAEAHEYVLGFTCADDVTARDLQRSDPQLTRGKGFDTFCPLGPWVETAVSLDDPVEVTCTVNGELRQSGETGSLLFDLRSLIAFVSEWTTLVPGDVILTGSPAGSAVLVPGDEVEVSVSGVGVLRHTVVADPTDAR